MEVDTVMYPWPAVGREIHIRPDTSDQRVLEDAMAGYHLPPAIFTPATVLDLGCNIGVTTAQYEAMWPVARVVGVEMDRENAYIAFALNTHDTLIFNRAISSHAGMRSYDHSGDAESYRLDPAGDQVVEAVTMDKLINGVFEGCCDFCKMDVEGTEWELFAVGEEWAPGVARLLVELHPHGAPEPPPEPWPVGRDGPSPLIAAAIQMLSLLGYEAVPHTRHPHAVWAVRP